MPNREQGRARARAVRGDDTLLMKAYGRADADWDVPMATDAMFEVGSIARQFTAAAVLQLRLAALGCDARALPQDGRP